MPNSRRRRFSVHNGITGRDRCKVQTNSTTSTPEPDHDIRVMTNNLVAMNSNKSKNKMQPNSSKNTRNIEIVADCDSSASALTIKRHSNITFDKDVTASSSNIDLFNILNTAEGIFEKNEELEKTDTQTKRAINREKTPPRRDKYPREHRVKVRSPKRRTPVPDTLTVQSKNNDYTNKEYTYNEHTNNEHTNNEHTSNEHTNNDLTNNEHTNNVYTNKVDTRTFGTEAINWNRELEIYIANSENVVETTEDERQSDHSLDDMCRICHGGNGLCVELGPLISACSCRGTVGRIHVKCLERWLTESGKSRCELCGTRYATRRVHRYGVPRALVMWILSQNAKQLMVDSLGIMLMSPLAVLAAWLSGRTLAGLMTQESHATPWPLASTFVLACMTLVCYYCWIVSAATRHALGWWIWYRSQYEVRLALETDE